MRFMNPAQSADRKTSTFSGLVVGRRISTGDA